MNEVDFVRVFTVGVMIAYPLAFIIFFIQAIGFLARRWGSGRIEKTAIGQCLDAAGISMVVLILGGRICGWW